jgi:VCBS repeat-containing protein
VFSDGTTFSLNANARMVLNEFVYGAGGAGNSAAISLVQGAFSFVAGQVAKTGDMRVETPVATMGIRGTAVLVEISASDGQTKFSVMVEPDGTTGSFNLYNKTTGALIGTVNNSGVGWVVSPAGPLQVVAQQVQKTPAELAQELGIVQQIFTIFNNNQQNPFIPTQDRGDNQNDNNPQTTTGSGSGTSTDITDGSSTSLPGLITNASNNPTSPPTTILVPLPDLPPVDPTAPPPIFTVTVTPNQPPVAVDDPDGTPDGPGDVTPDDPGNDSDPEGGNIAVITAQHVVLDEGGEYVPAGDPVQIDADGETVDGSYGTLTLLPDGTYTFEPNEAFDALADGVEAVDTFRYTISDPFGATASAILTINLTGVNDAPVVTGPTTGDTTEDGQTSALGALDNASDVDNGAVLSVVFDPEDLPPGVTYDEETHSFILDPSDAAYQSLAEGEATTVTVEYAVSDGSAETPASVTWTVTGTNDAPEAEDDVFENIPLGWTLGLDNHLYKYVTTSQVTWQLAAAAALAEGGYLATITSSAENDFVFSLVGNDVAWLGGSDAGQEGLWRWITEPGATLGSEPLFYDANTHRSSYAPWAGSEPNNNGDWLWWLISGELGEDYLVTWGSGNWNDLDNSPSDRQLVDGYVIERNGHLTQDDSVTISDASLLANDIDPDGDLLTIEAVDILSEHGAVVTFADGPITYDASQSSDLRKLAASQTIEDWFYYTVSDGKGGTSTAKVTLSVSGLNDAPHDLIFYAGNALGSAEGGLGIKGSRTLGQVLATDPDSNDVLSYSLGAGSSAGFTLSENGTLKTGLLGLVSKTYNLNLVATDQSGASTNEQLTVWVGNNGGFFSSCNDTKSFASQSNDVLAFGLNGNDTITTGSGNDVLVGGKGRDTLTGGLGDDVLTGGAGNDRFMFDLNFGNDVILDFESGKDTIETSLGLSALIEQTIPNFQTLSNEQFAELFQSDGQFQLDDQDAVIHIGNGSLRIADVVDGNQLLHLKPSDFVLQHGNFAA